MTPRQLLEAMNPRGVYDDWSRYEIIDQIVITIRFAAISDRAPLNLAGKN